MYKLRFICNTKISEWQLQDTKISIIIIIPTISNADLSKLKLTFTYPSIANKPSFVHTYLCSYCLLRQCSIHLYICVHSDRTTQASAVRVPRTKSVFTEIYTRVWNVYYSGRPVFNRHNSVKLNVHAVKY